MGFPFWTNAISPRKFYRARRKLHYSIDKMWSLPDGDSKLELGRANYEEESVLYCTDKDFLSCILEVVDREEISEQYLTLIEFENIKPLSVVPLGIKDREKYAEITGIKLNKEQEMIAKFLDDEFRMLTDDSARNYLNSSALAKVIREEFNHHDGISYKTVKGFNFSHYGLNFAFHPSNIKKLFTLKKATQYKFSWKENDQFQFNTIDSATGQIHNDGKIVFDKNLN